MELLRWILAIVPNLILLGLFLGRNWITAEIEKGVQHKFDQRIETLRSELHKSEEQFKSNLRTKEAEISSLREGVFSGSAQRQALLHKRRMKAVERVWSALTALGAFKFISASMAMLKYEEAAKTISREPKLQAFFKAIVAPIPDNKLADDPAKNERPFVSPLAWAYLSAYRLIVLGAYSRAKMLSMGTDPRRLFDEKKVQQLLKTALPHQADYIDKNDQRAYHYLLDELEDKLLGELNKTLEGREIDQVSVERSAEMMGMIKTLHQEQAVAETEAANADEAR